MLVGGLGLGVFAFRSLCLILGLGRLAFRGLQYPTAQHQGIAPTEWIITTRIK